MLLYARLCGRSTSGFDDVKQGKYVTVVIVSETSPAERNWIITAYITRRVMNGEIEWQKS